MKLSVLLFSLFLSFGASAQDTPPKKANTVLIQTPDSARQALRTLATVLQERGYIIDKIDYDLNSLSTKGKALAHTTIVLSISALYNKQALALRGQYHIESMGVVIDNQAEFVGVGTGGSKGSFREVEAIAKAYPGATVIQYEKR